MILLLTALTALIASVQNSVDGLEYPQADNSLAHVPAKTSFSTVRKTSNGIGVEKTWPLHSPHVVKVEVIRRGKVRRAKLNYLRQRVGKAAKVKERMR